MPRRSYERTIDPALLVRELLAENNGQACAAMVQALAVVAGIEHRQRHHHEVGALLEAQALLAAAAWRPDPEQARWGNSAGAPAGYAEVGKNSWGGTETRRVRAEALLYVQLVQRWIASPWQSRVDCNGRESLRRLAETPATM